MNNNVRRYQAHRCMPDTALAKRTMRRQPPPAPRRQRVVKYGTALRDSCNERN